MHANIVYQEYVSDREHIHMNATQWETLTDFVKWLGRDGHCVVDETPKGWFITYIDKDPEVIARQKVRCNGILSGDAYLCRAVSKARSSR